MEIRPYVDADHAAILELAPLLQLGVAPWRSAEAVAEAVAGWVKGSLADPATTVYVAAEDGQVAGFVTVTTNKHWSGDIDAYVGELAVRPAMQGRGVGRSLMAAAEAWAVERGLRRLTLSTGAANAAARAFYESLGYAYEDVRLSRELDVDPQG